MIALAVIERELRAVSRHTLTYNLRVLGVLVFVGVLGVFWLSGNSRPGVGGFLFAQFHRTLFFGIWFLVPLMTADCISRERREIVHDYANHLPVISRERRYIAVASSGRFNRSSTLPIPYSAFGFAGCSSTARS